MKLTQDQLRLLHAVVLKEKEQCPAISKKISDAHKHEQTKPPLTKSTVQKVPNVKPKQQKFDTAAGSAGKHIAPSKEMGLTYNAAVCSFGPGSSQNWSGMTTEATCTASKLVVTNLGKQPRNEPVKANR